VKKVEAVATGELLPLERYIQRVRVPHWPWMAVKKGHERCRLMADRHYTRQSVGHPMWTRPGFNFCLYASDAHGEAVWCWWRPKWEAEQERKDGLRVLECTIFRRERLAILSSELIHAAVRALGSQQAEAALRYPGMGPVDWLITGIGAEPTERGRSRRSLPGACYRHAGWEEFDHNPGRADVWLRHEAPDQLRS